MVAVAAAAASSPAHFLGYGVGLRRPHFDDLFDVADSGVDCVEILSENFISFGGKPRTALSRAAREVPLVLHGTALSIGSVAPLNRDYLDQLAAAIHRYRPVYFSDHICFSSAFGVEYHELLPLPFTEEAMAHVAGRAREVQAIAPEVPFLLENPSYYVTFGDSEMTELEFVRGVIETADCGLLLDVNNVYVNSVNHGYDPREFIAGLPLDRVRQLHMAGHTRGDDVVIDTHSAPIADEVLELLAYTLELTGPVTTIVEWDNDIPPLEVLLGENRRVRRVAEGVLGAVAPWRP